MSLPPEVSVAASVCLLIKPYSTDPTAKVVITGFSPAETITACTQASTSCASSTVSTIRTGCQLRGAVERQQRGQHHRLLDPQREEVSRQRDRCHGHREYTDNRRAHENRAQVRRVTEPGCGECDARKHEDDDHRRGDQRH